MAKPTAPSGWKRLRLPAPSSRREVVSLLGVTPRPLPLPETPQTRRGVEANGERSQPPVCPLTLELVHGSAPGRICRNSECSSSPRGRALFSRRREFANWSTTAVLSAGCVVLLLTVQARFSSGTKKASPSPPKNPKLLLCH